MAMRKTKIVATVGAASQDEAIIEQLILAGVNVFRINFSHGDHLTHEKVIQRIRKISKRLTIPVAILQDLQGPKIRVGEIKAGKIELVNGQKFTLTTRIVPGDDKEVFVDFPDLPHQLKTNDKILLDDGNLELLVLSTKDTDVQTEVVLGGELKPHKGINLPGIKLEINGFTQKDASDLDLGLQLGVDFIAVSFVRSSGDIDTVRDIISKSPHARGVTPIIAKLERPEAMENLEEIVNVSDGVMVARGDLGVEMSPEVVPIAQKTIIGSANQNAKIVITATQMLESMIHYPRPTRAETSDVANAIFDGSDAVMLSGETAIGKYPVQSVKMMNAIIAQAEEHMGKWGQCQDSSDTKQIQDDTYFMTLAAREMAHDRNVAGIAVFTISGRSALLMSKARPEVPIFAFTPEARTHPRLGIMWGVIPHLVSKVDTLEEMTKVVEEAMISSTPVRPGQQVVLICGFPISSECPANLALLHTVG